MNRISKPLSVVVALGFAACASGSADPAPSPGPAAAATAPAPAQPAATATPAAGGGHFSDAQADGGRNTFRSFCTECHSSGEFSDAQFKFKWSRRTAGDLYEMIFLQMPESAPGSLTPAQAVGLLSYIMRMNGFQAGTSPLAADAAVLDAISLSSIRN